MYDPISGNSLEKNYTATNLNQNNIYEETSKSLQKIPNDDSLMFSEDPIDTQNY